MKIDKDKIEELITQEYQSMITGLHCKSECCIGEIDGVQIHIVVVNDEDDFIDPSETWNCITE